MSNIKQKQAKSCTVAPTTIASQLKSMLSTERATDHAYKKGKMKMLLMAKCPDAKVVYIKTIAAITDTGMPITIVKNSGLAISVMGEAANV